MTVTTSNNLLIIGRGELSNAVAKRSSKILHPDFTDLKVNNGDTICWLPEVADQVDEQVQLLVDLIDQAPAKPAKIIVWSPAGTADDAHMNQLPKWWGPNWRAILAAYLYMVKMIDELEFPYTVVRSLPIDRHSRGGKVFAEGQQLTGESVGLDAVVNTVIQACQGKYTNQSVGVGAAI